MIITDDNREQLVEVMSFLGIDPNMVSRDDDIDFTVKCDTHRVTYFTRPVVDLFGRVVLEFRYKAGTTNKGEYHGLYTRTDRT